MHLPYDLYTIYGELLVKKDTEIMPAVVKEIREKGRKHKQVCVPMANTDIYADFEKVLDDERYTNMFNPPAAKKDISDIAGRLHIENDLIFELSTMKPTLPYTYYHILVVAALSIKLSLAYKPKRYDKEIVAHCGFTHDIGKSRVPIRVLNKRAKLTARERRIINSHPLAGYLMLNYYLKRDRIISSLVNLNHHERMDGTGYPNGIKRIDKYTELISVVDVLDALMTKRPYRKKIYSMRATLDYLLKEAMSKRFDKNVVLTLISMARKEKPDISAMKISKEIREELPEEVWHDKYA